MPYGQLPTQVRQMLATRESRMHHWLWHAVRNRSYWERALTPEERQDLRSRNWEAPRFQDEAGAGIDFLFMHRRMIAMTDRLLGNAGDPHYQRVVGWLDVPWDHGDSSWPMPPAWEDPNPRIRQAVARAKDQATTDFYRQRVAERWADRAWLRSVSIDELGTDLEGTIHGWMHMHWSAEPTVDPSSDDPTNDYLGSPYSSHVNDRFWKLHGWIDDRIRAWEDANRETADLTNGWEGAPGFLDSHGHTADPELFEALRLSERPLIMMRWHEPLLEGVDF